MIALLFADLRHRRRMLLAVTAACFAFLLVIAGTYSGFGGESAFAKLFGDQAGGGGKLLTALSGSPNGDLFTPTGFVAFGFVHPLFLVLSLTIAVSVGAGAVAGDVETGRAAVLYALPRRRSAFFRTRVGVWAVAQAAVIAGGVAGGLLGITLSPDLAPVSAWVVVRVAIQYVPVAAVIAAAAFAASAMTRTRAAASGVAVAVAAGGYLLNFVGLLWSPAEPLRWATPFAYYQPTHAASRLDLSDAGVLLGAAVVLLAVAEWRLNRRDLA